MNEKVDATSQEEGQETPQDRHARLTGPLGPAAEARSLLDEAEGLASGLEEVSDKRFATFDQMTEDHAAAETLRFDFVRLCRRLDPHQNVAGAEALLEEAAAARDAAETTRDAVQAQRDLATGLRSATGIGVKVPQLRAGLEAKLSKLAPARSDTSDDDARASADHSEEVAAQVERLINTVTPHVSALRRGAAALEADPPSERVSLADLQASREDLSSRVREAIGEAERDAWISENRIRWNGERDEEGALVRRGFLDNEVTLGGSWARPPDHPELGRGQDAPGVRETLVAFCTRLYEADFPVDALHEVLQSEVNFLDGMFLHDALRYERSPEILPRLYEEVRHHRDAHWAHQGRHEPDVDPDPA